MPDLAQSPIITLAHAYEAHIHTYRASRAQQGKVPPLLVVKAKLLNTIPQNMQSWQSQCTHPSPNM